MSFIRAPRRRCQDSAPHRIPGGSYMLCGMYWPLLGGFIAFVVFALIMGWIMDPGRHGDADRDHH